MGSVRNHMRESATLKELFAKQKSLQAELAECRANERRQRAVAKKLLQHKEAVRSEHDEAFSIKVANATTLNQLYDHYLDVKKRNDDIINGRVANPGQLTDDELKAEIVAAGDPWRQFKREVFEPSRQRYLDAKQALDDAKCDVFKTNRTVKALHEQCTSIESQLEQLAFQIVLCQIGCYGERAEYMEQLASMLDIADYAYDMRVKLEATGAWNVYFGQHSGNDHGHIAIDPEGVVSYRRMPNERHGSQNFLIYQHGCRQGNRQMVNRRMGRVLQYA